METTLIFNESMLENFFNEKISKLKKPLMLNLVNEKKFVIVSEIFNNSKTGLLKTKKVLYNRDFFMYDKNENFLIKKIDFNNLSARILITPLDLKNFFLNYIKTNNLNTNNDYYDKIIEFNKEIQKANCLQNGISLLKIKYDYFKNNYQDILKEIKKLSKDKNIFDNLNYYIVTDEKVVYILFKRKVSIDVINFFAQENNCKHVYNKIFIPLVGTYNYGNKVVEMDI